MSKLEKIYWGTEMGHVSKNASATACSVKWLFQIFFHGITGDLASSCWGQIPWTPVLSRSFSDLVTYVYA